MKRWHTFDVYNRERQERQAAGKPPGQVDLPESKEPQENKKPEEGKGGGDRRTSTKDAGRHLRWIGKLPRRRRKGSLPRRRRRAAESSLTRSGTRSARRKNENLRQAALRRSWLDREIARRALQQERGATREAVLRSNNDIGIWTAYG